MNSSRLARELNAASRFQSSVELLHESLPHIGHSALPDCKFDTHHCRPVSARAVLVHTVTRQWNKRPEFAILPPPSDAWIRPTRLVDFSTVLTAAQNACTRSLTLGYARSCSRLEEGLGGSSAIM